MTKQKSCSTCRFFIEFPDITIGQQVHGTCRIRSAPLTIIPTKEGVMLYTFPPRQRLDWCGEYQADTHSRANSMN